MNSLDAFLSCARYGAVDCLVHPRMLSGGSTGGALSYLSFSSTKS